MRPSVETWPVRRREGSHPLAAPVDDHLAAEEPLEIRFQGKSLVVTMRTPGEDAALAVGFLVNEGILRPRARVRVATVRNPLDAAHDNIVDVRADDPSDVLRNPASRTFHASSACGVCGQASLEDMARNFVPVTSPLRVAAEVLEAMPAAMRDAQAMFAQTGGLHAAALFDVNGVRLTLHEDIGRHNAHDKLTGWAHGKQALPLSENILVVSGRAGYEIVQKAVASGIPLVASVGAPSTLAAKLAKAAGVTLVGFLRPDGFNVYTHAERVIS